MRLSVYFGDYDPEQSIFNKPSHFPGADGFGEGLEWMLERWPDGYGDTKTYQALSASMYGLQCQYGDVFGPRPSIFNLAARMQYDWWAEIRTICIG